MNSHISKTPLWTEKNGRKRLQGMRCRDCGATAFPASPGCIVCGSLSQMSVALSDQGHIESRTCVGERQICEIRLCDGPRLIAWVDHPGPVTVGTAVRFAPADDALRFVPDE